MKDGDTIWANEIIRWSRCSDLNGHEVRYRVLVNYNDTGYAKFKTALIDTFVQLTGYDSLFIRWKVIAYDSEGDSSAWSTERLTHLKALVYDIDGNVYRYITIGTQTWLVENLKTTRYNDGTAIPLVTDNAAWSSLTTPGYCWNNNDIANRATYGALYNWYTINTGKLAPSGWHVPTDAEWSTLTTYLGGESVAGGKLKEAGFAHWQSPNTGATNETGFSALPGGFRADLGSFNDVGNYGDWWSATAVDATNSWNRYLNSNLANVNRYSFGNNYGFSVRCIRDL